MKLNAIEKIRMTSDMQQELSKIADELGFKKSDLIRFLLNRSLRQLKTDSIAAGGYDKLEFTLRPQ